MKYMSHYKEYYEFTKTLQLTQNAVHEDLKFHRVDSLATSTLPSLFHQNQLFSSSVVKVSNCEQQTWI